MWKLDRSHGFAVPVLEPIGKFHRFPKHSIHQLLTQVQAL